MFMWVCGDRGLFTARGDTTFPCGALRVTAPPLYNVISRRLSTCSFCMLPKARGKLDDNDFRGMHVCNNLAFKNNLTNTAKQQQQSLLLNNICSTLQYSFEYHWFMLLLSCLSQGDKNKLLVSSYFTFFNFSTISFWIEYMLIKVVILQEKQHFYLNKSFRKNFR